jgi:2-dehydropantoate 2-reductase
MEILVYGAGVIGSQYAARLRQAGNMVTLLARGQRAVDLREHGILLEAANTGRTETVHVSVKETLEEDDVYELVIVALRSNQLAEALPVLAANHQTPNLLFLGNNPAGVSEIVKAVGRERVVLGFGGLGGERRGKVVRYVARNGRNYGRTFLGELDGTASSRLIKITILLSEARLGPTLVPNMDAWLKTHAAVISPLALAIYSAGGDNFRLAHTPDSLLLAVRAIRESLNVLRALNIPILPGYFRMLAWLPEPLLVLLLRALVNTQAAQINIAGHANAARDEMLKVADDFMELVKASGQQAFALAELRTWLEPAQPPLVEGSASLPADTRALWIGGAVLVTLAAVGILGGLRRRK